MSEVKQGTTSRTEYFSLVDKTAGTPKTGVAPGNLTLAYTRTQLSTVGGVCSALASSAAAWSNLGAIEQDQTNAPGLYRVDVPNAAYSAAAGVDTVILSVIATTTASVAPALKEVQLVQNIESDVYTLVNTVGAAIDWAKVANKTTANDLSGTLISRAQSITAVTGAVASVTGNVAGSVGSVIGNVGGSVASVIGGVGGTVALVASVTGNVGGSVASVSGNVGGSVGSVVGGVGGAVAGAVGSVTGNVGGSVGSVVGNVGGSVSSVNSTVNAAIASTVNAVVASTVIATVASFASGQGPRVRKNVALSNFMFLMTDSTNHAPATGKTVTATRSIDGATFVAGSISATTEVASGWYRVDFSAGDLNGDVIAFRATATSCDDRNVTLITNP